MEDNTTVLEKIDDYLFGRMEKGAMEIFQAEIQKDKELGRMVAQQEKIHKAIKINGYQELKNELKDIHQDVIGGKSNGQGEAKVRAMNWRPLLAAASILFIGVLGWWLFAAQQTSGSEIFASNYKSFEMGLALRNGTADEDATVNKLASLYKDKKYQECIPLFEALLKNDAESAQLLMGFGIAKLETGDAKGALNIFEKVLASKNPFLSDEAKWYAALVYLKDNQIKAAIDLLQDLADDVRADHHEAARTIINLLK